MPAYMGMGFECRDSHPAPAPNEHYSKLYVFQMPDGPKGTRGPFVWGKNRALNYKLNRQKILAEEIYESIVDQDITWLLAPDATGKRKVIVWTQANSPQFVFAANLDTRNAGSDIPVVFPEGNWTPFFSTETESVENDRYYEENLLKIGAGEGLVWRRQ